MKKIIALALIVVIFVFNVIVCEDSRCAYAEMCRPDVEVYIPGVREYVPEVEIEEVYEETASIEEIHLDEEEWDLLAHLIFAEAGSDWCSDNMMYYVGSVVLNRIESEYFPNTMYEVIYQPGQYSCARSGMMEYEYNLRAHNVAEDLLTSGSCLPKNVLFQAQFAQGDGIYCIEQNMYFCYKGE